jgi:hypothetical protein
MEQDKSTNETPRLPPVVTCVAVAVLLLFLLRANYGSHVRSSSGIVGDQTHWHHYGWPATFLVRRVYLPGDNVLADPSIDNSPKFSAAALQLNLALAASICGLCLCTAQWIVRRQFSLRSLFLVLVLASILIACWINASLVSLDV